MRAAHHDRRPGLWRRGRRLVLLGAGMVVADILLPLLVAVRFSQVCYPPTPPPGLPRRDWRCDDIGPTFVAFNGLQALPLLNPPHGEDLVPYAWVVLLPTLLALLLLGWLVWAPGARPGRLRVALALALLILGVLALALDSYVRIIHLMEVRDLIPVEGVRLGSPVALLFVGALWGYVAYALMLVGVVRVTRSGGSAREAAREAAPYTSAG